MSTTFTIKRTGDAPLRFRGARLAETSSKTSEGMGESRWWDMAIYRTDGGKTVATIEYHSCWAAEESYYWADFVADGNTPTLVTQMRAVPCPPPGVGYPPTENFAERQARLLAFLRAAFDGALSDLLEEAGFVQEIA